MSKNITVEITLKHGHGPSAGTIKEKVTLEENQARALLAYLKGYPDYYQRNNPLLVNGRDEDITLLSFGKEETVTVKNKNTKEEFSFVNSKELYDLTDRATYSASGIQPSIDNLEKSLAALDKSRNEDENRRARNVQPQSFLSFSRTAKIVGMAAAIPLVAASIKYLHDKFTPK